MKTQEQVLKSPVLTVRVSQRLSSERNSDGMRAEMQHLAEHFGVRRVESSQLFALSYVAPNPEVAASLVNLFAEEYIKELFMTRQATREKAKELLEGELAGLEERVQASEKGLVQYARENNIVSIEPGKGDLTEERLAQLAKQVTDSEAEIVVCKSRQQTLARASVANFPEKLLTEGISSLASKVLQIEHDLTALSTSFGENWPAVIQKRNELALIRGQLAREKSMVLDQAREQAQLDLLSAESRRDMIAASMKQQRELVDRYRNASIQYNILRREVETNQKLYEGLLERLKQTNVTAGLDFGNIRVMEPGRPDTRVDSPKIAWNLGLAGLIGLALGICLALARDFWDNSVSTVEEAEQITFLPALGSVPLVKELKPGAHIRTGNGKSHGSARGFRMLASRPADDLRASELPPEAAEDIRSICASILLSKSDRPPHVIMITSATPGEGKTTLVNRLGQAFADGENRTLLVECDMRKPALSNALGIGSEGGLSLFLSGHISPLPVIHSTFKPNLLVVSAGPRAPNPMALLGSERLTSFLNEMTSTFQFILLDAPPVLAFADARVLCPKVDGVVLVVRAGHTPKNLIRRARTLLDKSGANVLGMVLNQAPRSGLEASYYRYYQS